MTFNSNVMDQDFFSVDYQVPFGKLRIVADAAYIRSVRWLLPECQERAQERISFRKHALEPLSSDEAHALLAEACAQLDAYFKGELRQFRLPILLSGTPFQQAVWRALQGIPYAETMSYQEIAVRTGFPRAARAVGRACHDNPFVLLVPCHRVTGKNHRLTGYAGGLEVKRALLEFERRQANHEKFLF